MSTKELGAGAVRELEIPSALNNLRSAVDRLEAAVLEIGSRIAPIMRNEPLPKPGEGVDMKKVVYDTPLVEDIRTEGNRIHAKVELLQSYINKLEL